MNATKFIKENYTLTNSGEDYRCNHSGQLVGAEDIAEEYHQAKLKLLGIADLSHSGYVCHIGKERVFIIAENIAQAMDKMEEIAGESVFGYSMESHSSIRVIHCG